MSGLYQQIFASYPFSINDPEYLRETITQKCALCGSMAG
jgi:hypothetical protein